MLAEKLNMGQDAAEKWIVNLIRNAKLDAKIDSKANHVIMGMQYPNVYQKVIEKTKGLSFRSSVLANNLAKSGEFNGGKYPVSNAIDKLIHNSIRVKTRMAIQTILRFDAHKANKDLFFLF